MSRCRQYRQLFVDAAYDEITPGQKKMFEAHLNVCPKCAKDYAGFSDTLKTMSGRKRPEPEENFWMGYWDRLAPELEISKKKPKQGKERHRWIPGLFPLPRWAYQAAAAVALLVIGIFIGKVALSPSSAEKAVPQFTERREISPELASLENRTGRYLERSKVLLLGIVNFDAETEDPAALNFSRKQRISHNLIKEASLLKQGLTQYDAQDRLINLISDLEIILLQIANLEKEHDLSAIDMVKSGVDRKGILLKINLEEMRRAEQLDHEQANHIST